MIFGMMQSVTRLQADNIRVVDYLLHVEQFIKLFRFSGIKQFYTDSHLDQLISASTHPVTMSDCFTVYERLKKARIIWRQSDDEQQWYF